MLLVMLPFIIAIGIFGVIAYKEAKSVLNLTKDDASATVKDENVISSMNYVLRDNATDIHKEYFAEFKNAVESDGGSDADVAGLVCKNFVADFYTWTNKQGQYDVGGLYYVYNGEDQVGDYKDALYLQARDSFYKYLSNYINDYGSENLLEVESVTVTKAQKASYDYVINAFKEWVLVEEDEDGKSYDKVYDDFDYDAYDVTCTWTYKENSKFDTSKFAKSMNFLVIFRDGRFEIVEASEKTINARKQEQTTESEDSEASEASETTETTEAE